MATAPTFTPAEVAAGQQFFSSNPTPEQIYSRASEIGLSPEQTAGLYQQSMGGDLSGLLGGVNDYLSSTNQTLGGGYKSGLYAPELTQFTPAEIIAEAQARTPEGGDVRQTLLDYGTSSGFSQDQIDQILGLAPGSTAIYSNSLNPVTPVKTPTINGIVNQIAGTPTTPTTINAPQAMGAYDTSNYFERYFPVSITGGGTNQTTGLSNVSGQSSLADILANIQGQYTPQQFTRSGGSYGAGRFLPADMAPASINKPGSTGFTPSEISKATEYFGQVTDPQQIFNRANEIGLSGTQLADLFSKSTGANYNDVLQSINNWTEATGQTLKGGYTPGSASWFEPASFDGFTQSQVNNSLVNDLTAEVNKLSSSNGGGESGGAAGSGKTIGVGAITDSINKDAFNAAVRGFMAGGPISAVLSAAISAGVNTSKVMDIVNQQNDPLGFLASLQGWTPSQNSAPIWSSSAYGGAGGFVNPEGNAPGASPGQVGDVSFKGEVGYDQ